MQASLGSAAAAVNRVFYGWDIGGAHLKLARLGSNGVITGVRQIACPLWRGIGELPRACALIDFPIAEEDAVHAITMTGELCDIFDDRGDGVRQILAAVAPLLGTPADIRVYGGYQGWLSPTQATGDYVLSVASANWLALAAFAAELLGDGLLIDVGSTTTDIITIAGGDARCLGADDVSRLGLEELVYTGVVRTPVMAVCRTVPYRGHWHNLTSENFATMADVYRIVGQLRQQDDLMQPPDNRGKDVDASIQRLARMLGEDRAAGPAHDIYEVAAYIARVQRRIIDDAVSLNISRDCFTGPITTLVGAGVGRFVVEQMAHARGMDYQRFDALVGADGVLADEVSTAAPAVAVAKLAWITR